MLNLKILENSFSFHRNLHHLRHLEIFIICNPNLRHYLHLHPAPYHIMPAAIKFNPFQEVPFRICSLVFSLNGNHVILFHLPSISCFGCNFWYQSQFSGFDSLGCRCLCVRRSMKHNFQSFLWSWCIYFLLLAILKILILDSSFKYFKQFPTITSHRPLNLKLRVPSSKSMELLSNFHPEHSKNELK